MTIIYGWPKFMKPATLAAFLDVSEPTIRDMERRGIIPKRHPVLKAFDSEAVLKALVTNAGGYSDADKATVRTLEKISSAPAARGRNRA